MMPGIKKEQSTPGSQPPSLKKSTSSPMNQKSIASFFQKKPFEQSQAKVHVPSLILDSSAKATKSSNGTGNRKPFHGSSSSLTPAPSSDVIEQESSPIRDHPIAFEASRVERIGLPSPITPMNEGDTSRNPKANATSLTLNFDSPSRKASTPSNELYES